MRSLHASLALSLIIMVTGCNFDDSYKATTQDDTRPDAAGDLVALGDMSMPDAGAPRLDMPSTQEEVCVPQPEQCNGLDDNCDGVVDEGCDEDGDGYCSGEVEPGLLACPMGGGDCDDTEPLAYPNSPHEVCGEPRDLDCDGARFELSLMDTLIQPQLDAGTHDLITGHEILAIPADSKPASLMMVWREKREVEGLWARAHDTDGVPTGPAVALSDARAYVGQFSAAHDPVTGSIAVVYTQKQDDAQTRLMVTVLDAAGQQLATPVEVPFEYNTFLAAGDFFFDVLEIHIQSGLLSIFFPFIDTNIVDYYHVAYDMELGEFAAAPKRIYSTTDLFELPQIGSKRAQEGERAGEYVLASVRSGQERIDVFELDAASNTVVASHLNRSHDATRSLVALSHDFDEVFALESSPNTATTSNIDRHLTLARITSSGTLRDIHRDLLGDYRASSDNQLLVKTGPSELTLFYQAYRMTMASPVVDLKMSSFSVEESETAIDTRLLRKDVDTSGLVSQMAYLPDTIDDHDVFFWLQARGSDYTLTSYTLEKAEVSAIDQEELFPAPRVGSDPYPYGTYPGEVDGSARAMRQDDGTMTWLHTKRIEGRLSQLLLRLDASGQPLPHLLIDPEPTGDGSLSARFVDDRLVAVVDESSQTLSAEGELVSCTHHYRTYVAEAPSFDMLSSVGSTSLTKEAYLDSRGTRRCEPVFLRNIHLDNTGELRGLVDVQEHIDRSSDPATRYNVLISMEVIDDVVNLDAEARKQPPLTFMQGSTRYAYTIEREDADMTPRLWLYDLEGDTPGEPFHTRELDALEPDDTLALNAIAATSALAVHILHNRTDYTSSASVLWFEGDAPLGSPRTFELGALPLQPPAWEVSYHNVYLTYPIFDGEKLVLSYSAVFSDGRGDLSAQRFVRVLEPADELLFPATEFREFPTYRGYTFLRPVPVDRGVMLIYQDDISHHVLHLDETLERELQHLTWKLDAGPPTAYEPVTMARTTHLMTNAHRVNQDAWSWYVWTDRAGTNDSKNTFYQMTVTCQESAAAP